MYLANVLYCAVELKDVDYSDVYFEFDDSQTIHADAADDDGEVGQFVLDFRDAIFMHCY